MREIVLLILLVVSFSDSFAQKTKSHHKKSVSDTTVIVKYGVASYYAKKFDGRRTATGEIFSSQKYTAASNQLPLNTWVKVTNLSNHKSVMVKINDRMHPKNKRLIDLSRIAAKNLGFVGRGLTRVKVEIARDYHPEIASQ